MRTRKQYMKIIKQLENLQEHCQSMAAPKDSSEIWGNDVAALSEAIDIISDYEKATEQTASLVMKYETAGMAIKKAAGVYVCPDCGKRAQPGHTHCHWCGKKLTWDRDAYARRDYSHLSKGGGSNGQKTKAARSKS